MLERPQQRVLQRDGAPLSLTPRLFSALLFFVDHAGELLDKDSLMQELWPGLVVEENNLSQVVSALRRALGDDGQSSRFIQTVPRRGYRFVASVTPLADVEGRTASPSSNVTETPPIAPAHPPARAPVRRSWLRSALGAGALAALASGGWWAWRAANPRRTPSAYATLAVLPFKPLHAEGRDELLEVGMADSLATRLSTVPGLVVRSVGSVMRFAGPQQDLARAARELDVAWIVDGSLQLRGDQLRVTARLLRTTDGTAAWSDSFDEQFNGVFDVQDRISERVQQALLPVLQAGAIDARMPVGEVGGTRSVEAYRLYLAASAQMLHQRGDGLRKGIALFQQAPDVDPGYALAWTGLADAHGRLSLIGDMEPRAAFAFIDVSLQRALALAPDLAAARASLGYKRYTFDFDWAGAEREFRHAVTMNSNVSRAHLGLGQMLLTQDRINEGYVHLRLARELDPLQPVVNALEASFLLVGGRLQEGRARLARTFELAPRLPLAFVVKGQHELAQRQTEQGIASLRQSVALAGGAPVYDALLGFYLAQAGQTDEARAILGRLQERARVAYVAPTVLATLHAGLGEVEAALTRLEEAYAQRDSRLVFLKDAPYWTSLRKEARFTALTKTLRLDQYGPGIWNP